MNVPKLTHFAVPLWKYYFHNIINKYLYTELSFKIIMIHIWKDAVNTRINPLIRLPEKPSRIRDERAQAHNVSRETEAALSGLWAEWEATVFPQAPN